jgi:uncharacterized protein
LKERNDPTGLESLQVVLTSACNVRCTYCYQQKRRGDAMPWGVLRAALDALIQSGHPRPLVSFHGGEPLLEFGLIRRTIDYLEEVRPSAMTFEYALVTNGTLFDDRIISELSRHRVKIGLSFDGVQSAQDLRAPGTFQKLETLIRDLQDRDPVFVRDCLTISMTLWSGNLEYLAESIAYLLELDVPSIAVNPLFTDDPGWRPDTIKELEDQFARVHRASREHLERTGKVPLLLFRRGPGDRRPGRVSECRCSAACGRKVAVDTDGRVYPCVVLAGSFQSLKGTRVGALVDSLGPVHVSDLVNPESIDQYATAVHRSKLFGSRSGGCSTYGACGDCRFVDTCWVCPVSIRRTGESPDRPTIPDHQCAFNLVALASRESFPPQPGFLGLLRSLVRSPNRWRSHSLL